MPPFVVVALGTLGAFALAKVIAAEAQRFNTRAANKRAEAASALQPIPLVRDPVTGDYRPRQQ